MGAGCWGQVTVTGRGALLGSESHAGEPLERQGFRQEREEQVPILAETASLQQGVRWAAKEAAVEVVSPAQGSWPHVPATDPCCSARGGV